MAKNDIHSLIEGYFDATLSEQEEAKLKQMLAETDDDSDDIREAKATMGLFATERFFTAHGMAPTEVRSRVCIGRAARPVFGHRQPVQYKTLKQPRLIKTITSILIKKQQHAMETNEYRNETTMAMGVLLCLWLKLDALLEYGMQHVSPFLIATCAVLLLAVAGRALWLALADRRRLCAIMRSLLKSDFFDAATALAFLMPLLSIEAYSEWFAYAAWVLGDVVLIGAMVQLRRQSASAAKQPL